jgi:histidyl-tRNA synthetase
MPIQAVKGTKDILPDDVAAWHRMEGTARALFALYGYREVRTPLFEPTELFARSIGQETDIVSKEMYTFEDRDGGSLTLRPEATAGIVRAVIEHNLVSTDPALRVYTMGPMFRRERPQKGRYRQFHQVNVEVFGVTSPSVDVEVIEMAVAYVEACDLTQYELVLNSVGDAKCRPAYVETLRAALRAQAAQLCGDCQRRTETNPLRVLDCKVPADQPVIETLPKISDHLCGECRAHFAEVRRELDLLKLPYRLSHRLVRGLDYYVRTTFEVVSGALGAQNSVLGGGRYDGLVKELGGPDVPGIGFALGMERLIMLVPPVATDTRCEVFLAALVPEARDFALRLQRQLRKAAVSVLMDHEGRGLRSQMKRADKLGARLVAIMGEDELKEARWTIRDMKASTQQPVGLDAAAEYLIKETSGG